MIRFTCFAALSAMLLSSLPALAADLVLVEKGVSKAPIIIFQDAPPYTRQAADELAAYLEKATGARPEIIEGEPATTPDRGIWVGFQPKLTELFPEIDFEFQHPEEIVITANENHLVIAGRDRWDPEHLVVEGIDEPINGRQLEYGTVNAVYTFLQDQLGVRWLWPGELGEDVPKRDTFALAPFKHRHHPQIRSRGGIFNFSALSNQGYGRSHDWTRLQRLQLDSLQMSGGHGFGDWWDRFHKDHPEYFALQPDGTRSGFPNPRTVKLCSSNPAVWKQWLEDVAHQLEEDPNQNVFNGSPNDGWTSGHCACENCRARDHPEGEPRLFIWHHYREERPALSDRDVTFANRLGEQLKEKYPDKDYRVLMLSYGHSRPAPVKARPADNVIMMSVANFLGRRNLVDRGSTWGTTHRDQFAAWGKIAPQLMWRPNTGSPAGWQQGLPDVPIHQTIEDMKFVAENNCTGIFIDAVWEHWATQGPVYYVLAQLAWNPGADAEAILNDYYVRAFGPAAGEVEAYFTLFENARVAYVDKHGEKAGVATFHELYTDELLAQARTLLEQAEAKAAAGPPIFGQRVAFTRAGFTWTGHVVDLLRTMPGYWETMSPEVGERVRDQWIEMEELAVANPWAINWGPVRSTAPRMVDLHPDHPNPKRKPSKAELERRKGLDLE